MKRHAIDGVIVAALLVAAVSLGTTFARGLRSGPFRTDGVFNQVMFAAGLMQPCGRGLTMPTLEGNAWPAPAADFLFQRRERIACGELAAAGTELDGLQRASHCLLLAVATVLFLAACGEPPAVTFRYDSGRPDLDFTRTVSVARRTDAAGVTRILMPVFDRFRGVEVSDHRPGCFVGVSRFADLRPFPLLLSGTLPPDWNTQPLYQRLGGWEGDESR